jgi:hypothetical protein
MFPIRLLTFAPTVAVSDKDFVTVPDYPRSIGGSPLCSEAVTIPIPPAGRFIRGKRIDDFNARRNTVDG